MTPCPITADRDEFRGAVTDRDAALKAAGFDNEGDLQYWGNSANRAEVAVLELAFARHRQQAEASFKAREDALVEALVGDLADYDAVVKACPANKTFLGDKKCPKCSAGPDEGCREEMRAGFSFVSNARALLARAHTAAEGERPDA